MMRKGVSPVIATVLLVILTLVAVGILAAFVIPFVNDSFKDTKECYDVLGKVRFDGDSLYNCHTTTPGRTGFTVRVDTDQALGLKVTFTKAGQGNTYSIEQGSLSPVIRMLGGTFNQTLDVPSKGGIRTYVASDSYERVEINTVLKSGTVCEMRESLTFNECVDPAIIAELTSS